MVGCVVEGMVDSKGGVQGSIRDVLDSMANSCVQERVVVVVICPS